MKTNKLLFILVFPILVVTSIYSQTTYTYPLSWNFKSLENGGPDLIQIPNNNGLTGEFTTRIVPASTCGQGGTAGGYFFEDDAGLQFKSSDFDCGTTTGVEHLEEEPISSRRNGRTLPGQPAETVGLVHN